MHEFALAQALVGQVRAAAEGRAVTAVFVEAGEFSAVVPAALRQAFRLATAGTELAGARLRIKRVRARFRCRACGRSFPPGGSACCPACRGSDLELAAGRELRLAAIEVEEQEP